MNRVSLGRWILVLLFAVLAVVWASQKMPAEAQSADEGRTIFEAQCVACHTIGGGVVIGPDLEGVATRRDRDWLARWIATPDVMLAEGDPIATPMLAEFNNIPMPNLGLSDAEVESLIVYLETAGPDAAPVAATSVLSGDAAIGKRMFEGVVRFENGGPPCLACHSVAGIGAFGGTLGPDLTQASDKYGAENLASLLSNPPFPTMNPIFVEGARLLTDQETSHLAAFLEQAPLSGRSTDALVQLVLLAGFGTAILLFVTRLVWRDRLTEVRRPMIVRSRARIDRFAARGLHDTDSELKGR